MNTDNIDNISLIANFKSALTLKESDTKSRESIGDQADRDMSDGNLADDLQD